MVPQGHLLRKIDTAIDFKKIYEFVEDLYCEDNGRPSVGSVVLFKIVLIQLTPHRLAASAWDTCPALHILTFLRLLESFFFSLHTKRSLLCVQYFFTVRFEGSISLRKWALRRCFIGEQFE